MDRGKTVTRSLANWDQQFRDAFVRATAAYGDRELIQMLSTLPKEWQTLSNDWHSRAGVPTLRDYLEVRFGKPKGL